MSPQSTQNGVVLHPQPPPKKTKKIYMPEDVIENILSFLSMKEVCSLSVLSKRLRNSWRFCRNLSFDKDFARNLSKNEYRNFVNNFFSSNSNTCADKFKLYYDATDDTTLISNWIVKAAGLKIKELDLDFTPSKNSLILSYDLVDIPSLLTMKLVNCELHLPVDSNGLRNLREITFQDVKVRPNMIEAIFVNCVGLKSMKLIKCNSLFALKASGKVLETLVVKDCYGVHSVVINSAGLRAFHYHGRITEFKFSCDVPCLSDVIFDVAHPRSFQLLPHRKEMVNSLAFVRTLTVTSTFLEGLTARYMENEYKDMEFCLWKLKELHLFMTPESFLNPSDVVIFLKKCPYIERIFINIGKNAFGNSQHWDNYGKKYLNECQIVFPFLKYVKIKGFTMKELPVTMARYLLKNGICLGRLIIVKARIHYFPQYYNPECLRLGVISNAEINIYDYHNDRSSIVPQHSIRDV